MRSLRIWFTVILVIIVLALAALISALYNNLNTQWQYETATAQYALDHTPISHITAHQTFTGSGDQEVFVGQDLFHQSWVAFVYGTPLQSSAVPMQSLLSRSQVKELAVKTGMQPQSMTLGYVNPNSHNPALKVSQPVVWEVYGTNTNGKHEYEYFDGSSGALVWKYML